MNAYQENQRFAAWVYTLLVPVLAVVVVTQVVCGAHSSYMIGIALCMGVVVTNALCLKVRVADGAVNTQLGWLVPFFWTRIRLKDVAEVRVVDYRPLRDAGGWGMRWGRFEGQSCTFWNARGDRGVLIETPGKRYIIGSQDPESLKQAIDREMGV